MGYSGLILGRSRGKIQTFRSATFGPSSTCSGREPLRLLEEGFYGLDVLPVTQPPVL